MSKKRCRICKSDNNVNKAGRCHLCQTAQDAVEAGMSYGKLVALREMTAPSARWSGSWPVLMTVRRKHRHAGGAELCFW